MFKLSWRKKIVKLTKYFFANLLILLQKNLHLNHKIDSAQLKRVTLTIIQKIYSSLKLK